MLHERLRGANGQPLAGFEIEPDHRGPGVLRNHLVGQHVQQRRLSAAPHPGQDLHDRDIYERPDPFQVAGTINDPFHSNRRPLAVDQRRQNTPCGPGLSTMVDTQPGAGMGAQLNVRCLIEVA